MTQKRKLEFAIVRSDGKDYLCRRDEDEYAYVANSMLTFTPGEDTFEIIAPDPAYRTKLYTYRCQKVLIMPQIYSNGWLAITTVNPDDPDEYEVLTVNLEQMPAIGLPNRTFVDINNQPTALGFLIKNKLATETHYRRQSGWVSYPMVNVNLALLYQHNPDAFQQANIL